MTVKIDIPPGSNTEKESGRLNNLGQQFENVVSRHRKFTVEFEGTLAVCVDQYKNIVSKTNRREPIVRHLNSVYNNVTTVNRLEELKEQYSSCPYCSEVSHCPVFSTFSSHRAAPPPRDEASNAKDEDETNIRRKELTNLVSPRNRINSSLPNIFLYSTKNMIQRFKNKLDPELIHENYYEVGEESSASNYIICMVKGGQEELSMRNAIMDIWKDATTYFNNNVLPFLRILSVSILITLAQWVVFIVRFIYWYKYGFEDAAEEGRLFGAFSGNLLKDRVTIYRIFTSTFFHNSEAHLIVGTIMHIRFSSVLERIHGAKVTLVIYFLTSAYGMVGMSWYFPEEMQANGVAGDWGVAGALLSRYFIFPYLIDREHQHVTNTFVSMICLLFAKTIKAGSTILVSTHVLSAVAGFCLGIMINNRLRKRTWRRITNLFVDLLCCLTLICVPVGALCALFLINPTKGG
ncbi:hypothetical protein BgAZ_400530 [Babesia gibsoni]|uniref:Peptidase S54 rhomboid domain-containing protein n=1 Tax=Babesia gibsoni TaxID=33632 RepID=A0AAD8PCG3_BABGI|nr:hypothetical protein BgAZ_400530 [Babesia gibsoni]